jgi:hypothetical protein
MQYTSIEDTTKLKKIISILMDKLAKGTLSWILLLSNSNVNVTEFI